MTAQHVQVQEEHGRAGPHFHLSRRQLLLRGVGGAAIATTYAAFDPSNAFAVEPEPATSTKPQANFIALEHATAVVFSADGSVRSEIDFPVLVDVRLSQTVSVEVVWDERVWSVATSAVIQDRLGAIQVIVANATGAGTATFDLPAGTSQFIPQARSVARFPEDLLDDVLPVTMTLDGTSVVSDVRSVPCAAWGAELLVSWTLIERQYVPAIVQVRSSGPFNLPEGLQVEYSLTAGGAALLLDTPDGASEERTGSGGSERRRVVIDLPPGLAPGEVTDLLLAIPAEEDESRPNLAQAPTVAIVIPDTARSDCRATGGYASAPVSDSGTALSDFVKVETA